MPGVKNTLRNLLPNSYRILFFKVRTLGFGFRSSDGIDSLLRKINRYFTLFPSKRKAFEAEIDFLNRKKSDFPSTDILPYPFVLDYDYRKVEVYRDEVKGLFYVLQDGKKLYYNRNYTSVEEVKKSYTYVAIEQHVDSPHRYLDNKFNVDEDDIVVDIGAAEGNFSLAVVDKVKELYLFEAEPIWLEALQATFEPWKNKVHIINKYVSDTINDNCTTLSSVFEAKDVSVIKMDVEGAETKILNSSVDLLKSKNLKLAVTTYHKGHDADTIKQILESAGYDTYFSKGFMLFIYDSLTPPYFRKGLIKAIKVK